MRRSMNLKEFVPQLPVGEHLSPTRLPAYRNEISPGVYEKDAVGNTKFYSSDGRDWNEAMRNRDQSVLGMAHMTQQNYRDVASQGSDALSFSAPAASQGLHFEDEGRMGREAAVVAAESVALGTAAATMTGQLAAESAALSAGARAATRVAGRIVSGSRPTPTVTSRVEEAMQAATNRVRGVADSARDEARAIQAEARGPRLGRERILSKGSRTKGCARRGDCPISDWDRSVQDADRVHQELMEEVGRLRQQAAEVEESRPTAGVRVHTPYRNTYLEMEGGEPEYTSELRRPLLAGTVRNAPRLGEYGDPGLAPSITSRQIIATGVVGGGLATAAAYGSERFKQYLDGAAERSHPLHERAGRTGVGQTSATQAAKPAVTKGQRVYAGGGAMGEIRTSAPAAGEVRGRRP